MAGSCDQADEPLGSIKCMEFCQAEILFDFKKERRSIQ
jgi:hypothetical protein